VTSIVTYSIVENEIAQTMNGYTGVKLLLAELSIAYIIIASSHNRRRPFHFLTNRRRNGRQNLILLKITFPLKIHQSHVV
jgi:hypothetical protein